MTDVVVLRALGLGDLLSGVPALRALRRALPDRSLQLMMPDALAPLVELAGIRGEVRHTDAVRRLPARLDVPRTDLAVNLHGRGPQSHRLLAAVADRVVAFGSREADVDGPPWRADEHERDRWCRLIATAFGIAADPGDLRLRPPDRRPAVPGALVVHPGAAAAARRWPVGRWRAVVRDAAAAGHRVVVTGTAAERALAERVAGPDATVLAGETDPVDLAALVASARQVVCGDTGVGHLAAAYGVSSVHLFGPTSPRHWGPPAGPHRVLWHGDPARTTGDPLGAELDPTLARITVAEVRAVLEPAGCSAGRPLRAGVQVSPP